MPETPSSEPAPEPSGPAPSAGADVLPAAAGGSHRSRLEDVSWRVVAKTYGLVAALLLTIWMWPSLSQLIGTVLVAAFAAVAADAVARLLQQLGLPRGLAVATVIIGAFTVAIGMLVLLVPALVSQAARLANAAPDIAMRIQQTDAWRWLVEESGLGDQGGLGDALLAGVQRLASIAPSLLTDALSAAVGTVFSVFVLTFAVIFLLTSGDRVLALAVKLVPRLVDARPWDVVAGAYDSIGRYVVGATVQATIAGVVVAAFLHVIGVPYALALGFITFLWDFVPMIGSTIAAIPAVAVALATGGVQQAIIVAVFITLYTQFENSVLQPRIQGKGVNMPAIAIFFSVLVGGALFGIIGAIFAVPAASVLAIILGHWFEYSGRSDVRPPRLFDDSGRVIRSRRASSSD